MSFFALCVLCIVCLGGARAETSTRIKAGEGYDAEGVRGLKALGVRDLTYRLAFLACSVQQTRPGVSVCGCGCVGGCVREKERRKGRGRGKELGWLLIRRYAVR